MQLNLAQVLNTLAHEIRTPLAVSQGYLKLYLDGRFTNAEDTRKAFEQTRQALGTLATLCVDMGKVSALSESVSHGIPVRVSVADFVTSIKAQNEVDGAAWTQGEGTRAAAPGMIEVTNAGELAHAVAIVSKAAFDEAREEPRAMRTEAGDDLIVLAGANDSLAALQAGPGATNARPVDFAKGGKGLKLIWAAFVLEKHHVQTWTIADHRASVGFRIPLVTA
jgi:signal transduction histidine kinase